jgi:hypothetical protein
MLMFIFFGEIMEEINKFTCLTYLGAARSLGISVWRIRYGVESGYLPSPQVVLKRRWLFSPSQVEAIRLHFEREALHRRQRLDGQSGGAR